MHSQFAGFVSKLQTELSSEVISIIEFGSHVGQEHPHQSDIDLLVFSKSKKYHPHICSVIRSIEKQMLHVSHSPIDNAIEETSFASREITGVHLILLTP